MTNLPLRSRLAATPDHGNTSLLPPAGRRGGDKPACGQLLRHLTTGFGQPCGIRWPLQVDHLPPPTTAT
jgi:hypothetical protein